MRIICSFWRIFAKSSNLIWGQYNFPNFYFSHRPNPQVHLDWGWQNINLTDNDFSEESLARTHEEALEEDWLNSETKGRLHSKAIFNKKSCINFLIMSKIEKLKHQNTISIFYILIHLIFWLYSPTHIHILTNWKRIGGWFFKSKTWN